MTDARRTPRRVAADALFAMAEQGAWSDGALHEGLSHAALSPRDSALATRLLYGTVQNRTLCDFYLRAFSSIRLSKLSVRVRECLRLGVYQLVLMDRIPVHAAVSETVELVRRCARADERTVRYANGVLRACARAVEEKSLPVISCPDKESYYALRYSHPEWLVRQWSAQFGLKMAEQICVADNADTPVSVRVNLLKTSPEQAEEELAEAGFVAAPHPDFPNILLCTGGDISTTAAFREGRVTIQDAASALCAAVTAPKPGDTVLDCCAAPGGKSFAMAEKMENCGTILSCDIHAHKLKKIEDGATRLGIGIISAEQNDATVLRGDWTESADCVLCDAPCSGFGIIRKKPEIRYKSEEETAPLPALQRSILETCAQYVCPGGTLVYSTCTVLQRENEDVARGFLGAHPEFEAAGFSHPACGEQSEGMVTLLPPKNNTDGFFIAKMRKKA